MNAPNEQLLELKPEHWPEQDRAAWDALFAKGSILDGTGPLAHWAPATRIKCAQSYGFWLAFLAQMERLEESVPPADRLTVETVAAYIDDALLRCTVETVHMRLAELLSIARAMAPGREWAWLERAVRCLRAQCQHGRLKPRAGISARELYDWGLARMQASEAAKDLSDKVRAVRFREGLTVSLLIARPLRLRSFLNLEIDRHLIRRGGRSVITLAPEDVKDQKAREYPFPSGLERAMRRYLEWHRPILLDGTASRALWITKDGRPFSVPGFVGQLAKLTTREFGETLRPHAFRHIAATTIAIDDPEHYRIVASILGHSSLAMAEKHYNRARGVEALRSFQELMHEARQEALQLAGRDRRRPLAGRRTGIACRKMTRDGTPPDMAD